MKLTWETAMGIISSTYSGIPKRKIGSEIDILLIIEHKDLAKIITNVQRLFNGCQELRSIKGMISFNPQKIT